MSRALVLNASFEPLCVVSTRRALILVIDAKAEVVHETGAFFHSERSAFPEPSVVRLCQYIRVAYQARVALNRRAIFARDGHRCQYCGGAAESIDHVSPRSPGGPHRWDNVAGGTIAVCRVSRPAVVLGSAQPDGDVDAASAQVAGIDVVRRRSGGGAVFVDDELVWADFVLSPDDPLWDDDVGRAMWWVGD